MKKTITQLLIFATGFVTGAAAAVYINDKLTNHYEPESIDPDELDDIFDNVNNNNASADPYDDPEALFDEDFTADTSESDTVEPKNC